MIYFCFIMGPTNVGKTTFINTYCDSLNINKETNILSVGKILRKKYGEDYFKGQQAPEHTENEVIELLTSFINDKYQSHKDLLYDHYFLIDGQPRTIRQLDALYSLVLDNDSYLLYHTKCVCQFIYLYCNEDTRMKRLLKRDKDDVSKILLSLKRFNNDELELNNIMMKMYKLNMNSLVQSVNTED